MTFTIGFVPPSLRHSDARAGTRQLRLTERDHISPQEGKQYESQRKNLA